MKILFTILGSLLIAVCVCSFWLLNSYINKPTSDRYTLQPINETTVRVTDTKTGEIIYCDPLSIAYRLNLEPLKNQQP